MKEDEIISTVMPIVSTDQITTYLPSRVPLV